MKQGKRVQKKEKTKQAILKGHWSCSPRRAFMPRQRKPFPKRRRSWKDVVQLFRNERGSGAVFLRGGAVWSHGMGRSVTQRSRSSGGFFGKLPPDDGAACPSRSYCRRETLRSHRSLQIIATNRRRRLRCRFHGRTGRADSSPGRLEDH